MQAAVGVHEAALPVGQPVAPLPLEAPAVGRSPHPSALLLVVLPLAHELGRLDRAVLGLAREVLDVLLRVRVRVRVRP